MYSYTCTKYICAEWDLVLTVCFWNFFFFRKNKSHHHHQANKLWGHTAQLGEDNEAVCETRLQLHNKTSQPREQSWTNPVSQRGVTGHFAFHNYSVSMIIQRVFFHAPQCYRQKFLWQDGQILECVDWPVSDWALKLRAVSFLPIIDWFCLKSNLFLKSQCPESVLRSVGDSVQTINKRR